MSEFDTQPTIKTVLESIDALSARLIGRLDAIEGRLDAIDKTLKQFDRKFDLMVRRHADLEANLSLLEDRVEDLERKN